MDRLNRWTNGNRSSKVTTPLMRKTSGWSKKPVKVIHPKAPKVSKATHTATHSATVSA